SLCLLDEFLIRLLHEGVQGRLDLRHGAGLLHPLVPGAQVCETHADESDDRRRQHWHKRQDHVVCELLPVHGISSFRVLSTPTKTPPAPERRRRRCPLRYRRCPRSHSSHPMHLGLCPFVQPHRLQRSWPRCTVSGCLHIGQSGTIPITLPPPSATPTNRGVPSAR